MIEWKHQGVDEEDQRAYAYSAYFKVEDYRKALEKLKAEGASEIIESGQSLTMRMDSDQNVEMIFDVVGGHYGGGAIYNHKLSDLFLDDEHSEADK